MRPVFGGRDAVLAELVEADPVYFLGESHLEALRHKSDGPGEVSRFRNASWLPGSSDSGFFASPSWLRERQDRGLLRSPRGPRSRRLVFTLVFKSRRAREELRRMIIEQDIPAMEKSFHRVPAKPGEVFLVPGGVADAIGEGVLMVEVMEPTDFVVRMESKIAGRVIPKRHFTGAGY